jgi:hypothetical protein
MTQSPPELNLLQFLKFLSYILGKGDRSFFLLWMEPRPSSLELIALEREKYYRCTLNTDSILTIQSGVYCPTDRERERERERSITGLLSVLINPLACSDSSRTSIL